MTDEIDNEAAVVEYLLANAHDHATRVALTIKRGAVCDADLLARYPGTNGFKPLEGVYIKCEACAFRELARRPVALLPEDSVLKGAYQILPGVCAVPPAGWQEGNRLQKALCPECLRQLQAMRGDEKEKA